MSGLMLEDADGTLEMLRDSVAGFADRVDGPEGFRARRDAGQDMDAVVWSAMAEAGWLGLHLPEEIGGAGLGMAEQAVLSEALGRVLITEPLAQLSVFAGVLLAQGQGAERDRLSAGLVAGTAIVAPSWQDRDGMPAPVKARAEGGTIRLTGEHRHVSAPLSATDFLVLAETGGDWMLLSVPAGAGGLTVASAPTLDGSLLGHMTFRDVAVPETAVLARGNTARAALETAISATRLTLAAELAGLASEAIDRTVAYTRDRVQFGKAIASFQVVQHRLVDMWSAAEFAQAAVVHAVETLAEGPGKAADLAVLAAKARAGDAAVTITRQAIHLHGAMGFTDACDIGLFMKRAVALNATLGQPEALRLQFVARESVAA